MSRPGAAGWVERALGTALDDARVDLVRWLNRRTTRDCVACGRRFACEWSIDSWVCRFASCGSEWTPEEAARETYYADPSAVEGRLDDLEGEEDRIRRAPRG